MKFLMNPQDLPTAIVSRLTHDLEATESAEAYSHTPALVNQATVLRTLLFGGAENTTVCACPVCGTLHTTEFEQGNINADETNLGFVPPPHIVLDDGATIPIFLIVGSDKQTCGKCNTALPVLPHPDWVLNGV